MIHDRYDTHNRVVDYIETILNNIQVYPNYSNVENN